MAIFMLRCQKKLLGPLGIHCPPRSELPQMGSKSVLLHIPLGRAGVAGTESLGEAEGQGKC